MYKARFASESKAEKETLPREVSGKAAKEHSARFRRGRKRSQKASMAPIFENTDLLAHTCGLLDAADIARLCQSCRFVPEHIRDVKTIKFLSTMRSDAVLVQHAARILQVDERPRIRVR